MKKRLFSFLLVLVLFFSMPLTAFAANPDTKFSNQDVGVFLLKNTYNVTRSGTTSTIGSAGYDLNFVFSANPRTSEMITAAISRIPDGYTSLLPGLCIVCKVTTTYLSGTCYPNNEPNKAESITPVSVPAFTSPVFNVTKCAVNTNTDFLDIFYKSDYAIVVGDDSALSFTYPTSQSVNFRNIPFPNYVLKFRYEVSFYTYVVSNADSPLDKQTGEIVSAIDNQTGQITGAIDNQTSQITGAIDNQTSQITGAIDEQTKQDAQYRQDDLDAAGNTQSTLTQTTDQIQSTVKSKWELLWYPVEFTQSLLSVFAGGSPARAADYAGVVGFAYDPDTGGLVRQYGPQSRTPSGGATITFPAFTLPVLNLQLWDSYSYDLSQLPKQFPTLFNMLYVAVGILELYWFVGFVSDKYHSIFGGGNE